MAPYVGALPTRLLVLWAFYLIFSVSLVLIIYNCSIYSYFVSAFIFSYLKNKIYIFFILVIVLVILLALVFLKIF